jgi:elongation factor Ts
MAAITAALVKDLREKSGAGMMDCKKALTETDGDLEAAVDWLRKKGLSAAAKKAGRIASEGLVGVAVEGGKGALIEVNSETDFVAKNEQFQSFVKTAAGVALGCDGDMEAVKAADFPGKGRSVADELTDMIATIGENMNLRRAAAISGGTVAAYVHNAAGDGIGKIGVLVAMDGGDEDLGKQIAMHVAAANPQFLSRDDVDQDALDRERSVLAEQARASGKPEEIVEKMVEGRMRKYYEEVCLLDQTFVIDGENKVAKVAEGAGAKITGFVRFALGEGLEKKEEDFAAEVAAAAAGG